MRVMVERVGVASCPGDYVTKRLFSSFLSDYQYIRTLSACDIINVPGHLHVCVNRKSLRMPVRVVVHYDMYYSYIILCTYEPTAEPTEITNFCHPAEIIQLAAAYHSYSMLKVI